MKLGVAGDVVVEGYGIPFLGDRNVLKLIVNMPAHIPGTGECSLYFRELSESLLMLFLFSVRVGAWASVKSSQ